MKIEVSIGEVLDKVSILEVKLQNIKDPAKRANIQKEYDILMRTLADEGISLVSDEYKKLKQINLTLWKIEDKIRRKEQRQEFDEEFIQLARLIYHTNDERATLKKEINLTYGSNIVEEKEYVNYKKQDSHEQSIENRCTE